MSRKPPSLIYFDLGNVLLKFDHQIGCRQIAELTGLAADEVSQMLFAEGLEVRYERGEIDSRQFYELFCARSGTRPEYEAWQHAGSAIFELHVPVVPVLAHLKYAGHRLGVLSNTCENHWHYLSSGRYCVIPSYFDVFALSFQVKALKPAPEMYQAAARLAGVEPADIFYMDDRAENVDGARAVGFDAVQFTSAHELARALRERGVSFNY
jgi:putative hydrolase of the HAD superfamily